MDAGVATHKETVDVAVCGGGLVGAALACMLSGLPLRMVLLEAGGAPARRIPRALALSWASRHILEACSLWPALAAHATPIREVHVAAPRRLGALHFKAADMQADALGFVVSEERLLEVFWSRMAAAADIQVYRPAEVVSMRGGAERVQIQVQRPGQAVLDLDVRLLAASDGMHSRIRTWAGVHSRRVDYHQSALVMRGRWERDLQGAACERLTPQGPLAMLPTGGANCKLVYSLAQDRAAALRALPEEERLQRMQKLLGRRHGRLLELSVPDVWPLTAGMAMDTAPRVVLLGDAATHVHPIAAQGFNRCLRELAALADLLRALPAGADPGSAACLHKFEERVQPDRRRVFNLTHSMARFLGPSPLPMAAPLQSLLQGLGMAVLDVSPGLKRHWLHLASGRYGCQPAWARRG